LLGEVEWILREAQLLSTDNVADFQALAVREKLTCT